MSETVKSQSVYLPAHNVAIMPVVAEGQVYHLWDDDAGLSGCDIQARFWEQVNALVDAGYIVTLLQTVIFNDRSWYKIRIHAFLSSVEGAGEIVKGGAYYTGDNPRAFFQFFGVHDDDIEAVL